jgi:8-amino-7-oxononanoate synthase
LRRAEAFSGAVDRLAHGRINPLNIVIDGMSSAVEATVGGMPTILFGTNSYLGLNFHPRTIEAALAATRRFGTGSTASRVASGNHRQHIELEADVAALYGRRHAIVFSTGFMANLGVIGGLIREGDKLILDAHCHASIFAAARMSGAQVCTFRHNDAEDLDRLLQESDIPGPQTVVIVEGVYSIWGDVADLRNISAIAKCHSAVVVVDEAHAVGMYGSNSRGICELLGVEEAIDVIVGTFSKSVGVIGGYCVSNLDALRSLRYMAQPYLYTASLPPAVVAAAREALRLIGCEPNLRESLWRNAYALHEGLTTLGLEPRAAPGPVGSIRMASSVGGYEFWKALLSRGIFVNLLMPPATPSGEVVLRFSVSAAHKPEHIEMAMDAFREVSRAQKV